MMIPFVHLGKLHTNVEDALLARTSTKEDAKLMTQIVKTSILNFLSAINVMGSFNQLLINVSNWNPR